MNQGRSSFREELRLVCFSTSVTELARFQAVKLSSFSYKKTTPLPTDTSANVPEHSTSFARLTDQDSHFVNCNMGLACWRLSRLLPAVASAMLAQLLLAPSTARADYGDYVVVGSGRIADWQ